MPLTEEQLASAQETIGAVDAQVNPLCVARDDLHYLVRKQESFDDATATELLSAARGEARAAAQMIVDTTGR